MDSTLGNAEVIRSQCWEAALHAYGTSYVFRYRARTLRRNLQLLNFASLAVPFLVGALVLAFGEFKLLPVAISIGAALGIMQALGALWSVVGSWVDNYSYAAQSASANELLATRFRDLGKNPPSATDELALRYQILTTEDQARREQDHPKDVTDEERRMGMRAALRWLQKACAGCGQIPTSMTPNNCDVCGSFKFKTA